MTTRFDEIWVPQIGEPATAALRRNAYLTLITIPSLLVLAFACSFAFASHNPPAIVAGVLCAAVGVGAFWIWIRSRRQVAAEISEWFGVRVSWHEMPRMRAKQFDAWCEQRDFTPVHGHG